MFFKAMNLQLQNYWLSVTSIILTITLGLVIGLILMLLPGVTEFLLIYTEVPLYSITAVLLTLIRVVKD